jgi:hypothetical protein
METHAAPCNASPQFLHIHYAVSPYLHPLGFTSALFHITKHRAVFDRRNHRLPSTRQQIERMQRRVHAFRPTGSKHDLIRPRTDHRGHLLARHINRLPRLLRLTIGAGWIRIAITQPWQHRIKHLRQQRRGRVGIQINHASSILSPRSMATVNPK